MSDVYVSDCESYDVLLMKRVIQDTVDELGGWDKYVRSGQRVLLKINLIGPKKPEHAATTNPEFVRAVGQLLKEHGADVYVGDSSGGAIAGMAPTKKAFVTSGIQKIADEEGFTILNFDELGPVLIEDKTNYTNDLYITKAFSEVDVVINLPKMKTHSMGIYTGAVKNLFGAVAGLRKAKYHKESPDPLQFGEVLADIHMAIDNMPLHLMDGIVAMQGEGPTAGDPYAAGKILISEDPLALDRVCIEMMGIEAERVSILKASIKRGIGTFDKSKINVHGNADRLEGFTLPRRYSQSKVVDYSKVKGVIDFFKAVPVVNRKKCVNCNSCVDGCPVKAIDRDTKFINYDLCIDCLCCHELCMIEAIDLKSDKKLVNVVRAVSNMFYK
ncbi:MULTISPECIES: DUF362 domain-containing protein [unclassified Fusibacter]|uniref:DUF362 domain-containing protein n=1 Tax=unclassified Fusibacter TaxID=2624464 RepID=UPI0013E92A3A|nr:MULTISPECIES: DUF362 domain-containing protein [unclassified Fusibacter]MCK8058206.1 DUF362 domain-containing protein [Fusibacter sp. A2]NPE20789.1 DUF362 domain-containing protein [Fusibacter sp. A1]